MDFEGFPQEGDRIMQSESKMQVLGIYRVYLPGNLLTREREREREREEREEVGEKDNEYDSN